jgi:GTP cyclohydrolase I
MAFSPHKTDPVLGQQVHQHLLDIGLETPMIKDDTSDEVKIALIEENMFDILSTLGLDMSDDSLEDTPKRVAKMFVKEFFWGLNPDHFPKCTTVQNKMKYDTMVVERNITVMSNCEHHIVTITGNATVAYIPDDKVLGLSKMNRIVEYFSRRPQIQERLTEQIYHALAYILGTPNVAVMIDAEHFCVKTRGVEDINSSTITSKLGGLFIEVPEVRAEFMAIANKC